MQPTFAFQRRRQRFQNRIKRAIFEGHSRFYKSAFGRRNKYSLNEVRYQCYTTAAAAKAVTAAMAARASAAAAAAVAATVAMSWVQLIERYEGSQVTPEENRQGC